MREGGWALVVLGVVYLYWGSHVQVHSNDPAASAQVGGVLILLAALLIGLGVHFIRKGKRLEQPSPALDSQGEPEDKPAPQNGRRAVRIFEVALGVVALSASVAAAGVGVHAHIASIRQAQKLAEERAAAKRAAALALQEKVCRPATSALADAQHFENTHDPVVGIVLVATAKYAGYLDGCLTEPFDVDATAIVSTCRAAEGQDPTTIGGNDQFGSPEQVPNPDYKPNLINACLLWDQVEQSYAQSSLGGGP